MCENRVVRRWKTVVPLHDLHLSIKSFQFAPGVTLSAVPDWLRDDELLPQHSKWDLGWFKGCTHCLIHDYEAEALGSPDPLWKGANPRSIQEAKTELSYLANLA